jgi:thymidylate synthase ThyX
MFIDGVSIWLAYYVWSLCPTAGGQESSTRYIKLSPKGLIQPQRLGVPSGLAAEWTALMEQCFQAYHQVLHVWEDIAARDPAVTRSPNTLLNDPSEVAARKVSRLKRNYAFDRARYFLPVAAKTNLMLLMSARGWVQLCQHLLSHPVPEAREAGTLIREELQLAAPRMLKHAASKESIQRGIAEENQRLTRYAQASVPPALCPDSQDTEARSGAWLEVMPPPDLRPEDFADALRHHDNRYAWAGSALKRTAVRFGWEAVAMAEIRDLNRHRTGTKHCPLVPLGFYFAAEQMPSDVTRSSEHRTHLRQTSDVGRRASHRAHELLAAADPTYIYWTLLGSQYPFEHTTTADKFVYEAELRTGVGAHFRYAQQLCEVLALWYERFPQTRGLILEGSAEPE